MRRGGDEEQIADSRLDVKTSFGIKHVPCGLVVRISGSHPGGRGSIPRTGDVSHQQFPCPCRQSFTLPLPVAIMFS